MALVLRRAAEFESAVTGRASVDAAEQTGREVRALRDRLELALSERTRVETGLSRAMEAARLELSVAEAELRERCEDQARLERSAAVREEHFRTVVSVLEGDRSRLEAALRRAFAGFGELLGLGGGQEEAEDACEALEALLRRARAGATRPVQAVGVQTDAPDEGRDREGEASEVCRGLLPVLS